MSIDLGTLTTSIKDRTYRIEITVGVGEDPTLRVYREKVWLDNGTVVRREDLPTVTRTYSNIASKDFNGMTGEQLYAKIAEVADILRTEDIGI